MEDLPDNQDLGLSVQENAEQVEEPALKLQQLRELIVSPDVMTINELQASIDEVENDIHDPEFLLQMMLPVLEPTIQKLIKRNNRSFSHSLAPSIPRAMRMGMKMEAGNFFGAIGRTVSNIVTFGAYDKRMGIPRDTDDIEQDDNAHCFAPEAVYLIHKHSHELLAHVYRNKENDTKSDGDYLSNLIDTVKKKIDALKDKTTVPPFKYGDNRVTAESGANCFVIIVLREGWSPTPSFIFQVRQSIANIEHHYLKEIDTDSSEAASALEDINLILRDILWVDGISWINGGRGANNIQPTT